MKPVTILATMAIVLVSGCGDAASSDGTWRFKSLHVDGEQVPIEQPLFMDISDDGFRASTTCNTVSGDFSADIMTTLALCGDEDAMTNERYMSQAFENEPTRDGDQLAFDDDSVRLVYEAFTDPQPAELFAVLGDPSLSVDESQLPPENVTGSVPPDFESLVPLPSPSSDVDLFLGTIDGNVCIVYGSADAIDNGATRRAWPPYARRPSTSRSTVLRSFASRSSRTVSRLLLRHAPTSAATRRTSSPCETTHPQANTTSPTMQATRFNSWSHRAETT